MSVLLIALLVQVAPGAGAGQTPTTGSAGVGISLAPAVVMLKGRPGQSHRQSLQITNHTPIELVFKLEAQDIVVVDGRRLFVAAGERSDSIAATAVFSPGEVVVPPHSVGNADITLTVPPRTAVRAVAAIFSGQRTISTRDGVAMSGSLGVC